MGQGSKSAGWSVAVALCAIMLMLWAAIFLRLWGKKPDAPVQAPAPATAAAVPLPAAAPPKAGLVPKTEEGKSALRIATLLSDARVRAEALRASGTPPTPAQKEQGDAVEREARDLALLLAENLRKNPASWPEVLDLAGGTEDLKVALRLGSFLSEAMDGTGEGLCVGRVSNHLLPRTRQVAATALAGAKSLPSLTALVDAADRDADGGVRLAAVMSLAQRRMGTSQETQLSIESALRRRAQSDSDEYVRQVAKNLVDPEAPPNARRPDPAKRRPPLPPAPPK